MRWSFLIVYLLVLGCDSSGCGTEVIGRELSPGHKLESLIFERNCGATTGFVRGVAVLDKERGVSVDIFLIEGRSEIAAEWLSDQKLTVNYSGVGKPPFTQLKSWQDLVIEYK